MPPKLNPIWNHFTVKSVVPVPRSGRFTKMVECNICQKVLTCSSGTTSPLRKHLSARHKDVFFDFLKESQAQKVGQDSGEPETEEDQDDALDEEEVELEEEEVEEDAPSTSKKSEFISEKESASAKDEASSERRRMVVVLADIWKENATLQAKADVAYLLWLARTGAPLTLGKHDSATNWLQQLNTAWSMKEPEYYAQTVCKFTVNEMVRELQKGIKFTVEKRNNYSLTATVKSGEGGQRFLEIHHTFIDDDFKFTRNLLGVLKVGGKADDLDRFRAQVDMFLMDTLGLEEDSPHRLFITFDSHDEGLVYFVSTSLFGTTGFPCHAHLLAKVYRDALEAVPQAKQAIQVALDVNTKLNQQPQMSKEISKLCKEKGVKFTMIPINDVGAIPYEVLVGVLKMEPALAEMDEAPVRWHYHFLTEVVEPLMLMSMFLEKFSKPGLVLPRGEVDILQLRHELLKTYKSLKDKVILKGEQKDDELLGLQFAKNFLAKVINVHDQLLRTSPTLKESSWVACMLHPALKGQPMFEPEDHAAFIKKLVSEHPSTKATPKKVPLFKSPLAQFTKKQLAAMGFLERKKLEFKAKAMKDEYEKNLAEAADKYPLEREFAEFMNLPDEDEDVDVLAWWKKNAGQFPILSEWAKNILAIQFGIEDEKVKKVPLVRSWTAVDDVAEVAGADVEDLLFIQRSNLDLMSISKGWSYKDLFQAQKLGERVEVIEIEPEVEHLAEDRKGKGKAGKGLQGKGKCSKRDTSATEEKPAPKKRNIESEMGETVEAVAEDEPMEVGGTTVQVEVHQPDEERDEGGVKEKSKEKEQEKKA